MSFLAGASDHKITRIWAVSAYYDIESIEQLIAYIKSRISKRPKSELFIVIGTVKHEGLKDLQKVKFGNEFKEGSGIRVTNCGYLFHSKGYLVETTRDGMCAIGSMNLTKYGLKEHEEILAYSQYKRSKALPPLVKSFKKYVEDWHSDKMSKEIGAVSQGEKGIRWLPENKAWNEARNKFIDAGKRIRATKPVQNEFVRGNDSNGSLLAPPFPDITDESAVQWYFGEELNFPPQLNDPEFEDERKFTLALYRLLFEECGKNPDECRCKHDGVTLQYRDALWRRGFKPYHATWHEKVGNKMQHWACSARFDVTLKGKKLTCYIFVYPYPYRLALDFLDSIRLGVCVGNKQNIVLQLDVSKHWEKVRDGKSQYWKIYSDGARSRVKHEKVLSAVDARCGHWIKKPSWSKKKLVHLDKLYVAKEVTWENSKKFLARLLHYAIIRAEIKS